jgi:hypothetical protein
MQNSLHHLIISAYHLNKALTLNLDYLLTVAKMLEISQNLKMKAAAREVK